MNRFFVLTFASLFLALILPYSAVAEKAFPCLRESVGKNLVWSASWQNDREDDQISYQIVKVLHFETNSSYTMVLKLMAESKATKEIRHLPIASAAFASDVCTNLVNAVPKTRRRSVVSSTPTTPRYSTNTQPQFIKYLRQGWVRADLPRTQIPLDTCVIRGREFLCLEEEKLRYGEQLQTVAEQIEAQPRLGR